MCSLAPAQVAQHPPGDGNGDGLCTEVDALMALKMAVGLATPDPAKMDVDGDGQVSEVDALQILKWAVAGGRCGAGAATPTFVVTLTMAETAPTPSVTAPEATVTPAKATVTPAPEVALASLSEEELANLIAEEYEFGRFEASDLDNDGTDDKYEYAFASEEVAQDLFLDRSLGYERTGSESFEGKIRLSFEHKGDEPIEYSHIEDIPKSFAASVDDIEFSVPPDEVIEADPKVFWKGLGARVSRELHNRYVLLLTSKSPHEAQAQSIALVLIGRGVIHYGVEQCHRTVAVWLKDQCLLDLAAELGRVSRHLNVWTEQDLMEVCDRISKHQPGLRTACRAVAKHDANVCSEVKDGKERDFCKAYVIEAQCESEQGAAWEACVRDNAVKFKTLLACYSLPSADLRLECAAAVSGDKEYCKEIKDKALRDKCLASTVYDIKSWFPDATREDACNRFWFPDLHLKAARMGCWDENLGAVGVTCSFEDIVLRGDWTVSVAIEPYSTEAEAAARAAETIKMRCEYEYNCERFGIDEHYGPLCQRTGNTRLVGHTITYDKEFESLAIDALHKNCVIIIREWKRSGPDKLSFKLEELARQIIDEKLGQTKAP